MRELVTIQVGTFANYIGSHFWNFQDELLGLAEEPNGDLIYKNSCLDMDVLYRAGETRQYEFCCRRLGHVDGPEASVLKVGSLPSTNRLCNGHGGIPTYNPRLLSIGFQGSLGSLSLSSSLCDNISTLNSTDVLTWTGKVSRSVAEPHTKNLFLQSLTEEEQEKSDVSENDHGCSSLRQNQDRDLVECLENDVKYWTDFSKVQYHTRSLYELNSSWIDIERFDNYGIGKNVLAGGLQVEEINERLRLIVEECDHIQGIQSIVDDSGGFSSVAAEILENIADEYTNTPVLLYTVRDPSAYACDAPVQNSAIASALHDSISFSRLSCFCQLMVPVGLPSLTSVLSPLLCVEDQKPFHSSAVYAASVHSLSIPFRMQMLGPASNSSYISGAMDVGEIVHTLTGQARQNMVAVLDVAMPLPSLTNEIYQGSILKNLHPLNSAFKEEEDLLAVESLVVHGGLHSGDQRATVSQIKDSIHTACRSGPPPLFSRLSVSLCPLPIPLPFPSIFASNVGPHGDLVCYPVQGAKPRGSLEIESIPMAARLRSSTAIMPFIEKRLGDLRKYGTVRGAPGAELLSSWGFGKDEVHDMGEHLAKLLMAFDPHSHTTSDSD